MKLQLLCLLVLLVAFAGCGKDDPAAPSISNSEIQAIVDAAGKLEPLAPDKDEITDTRTEEVGDLEYTYETHDVVDNITSVTYLGLNDDIIWPGSLIRGSQAHSFVYDPITVPRAPLTLSVSLETSETGGSLSQVVEDPKLSTIRQGISDLLADAIVENTSVPAKVEFSYEQVFNQSHMSVTLDADVSYGLGDLDTAFDWNSTTQTTKIVAKYKQIYYSIDMDTPANAAALFPGSISTGELKTQMPEGSMPMYVSGVSYGLMAIMTIQTGFSYESMNLAIDAAYSGTVDVEIESGMTAQQILEESSIRIVVYGGSTQGLSDIELGFDGFMRIVEASTQFTPDSPGVPLVYKFRHLKDNTLALVTQTSQYTLIRPVRVRQKARITALRYVCEMADDEGADNAVDMDRFNLIVSAFNRINAEEPLTPITAAQNAVVYQWSTPGEVEMNTGYIWTCSEPNTFDVTFNTKLYEFGLAEMQFSAYARDWDGSFGDPEDGTGYLTLQGNRFLDSGGLHSFLIESADFRFRVEFQIEFLD